MGEVMAALRERLPADAILTNGAGNFSVWTHRFYEFRQYPTQLAPTSGAMGYGVPAAVAAKLLHPDRIVVAIAGDGDFLMTGQELATAVQYEAPIVVLVVNNGMLGTIRMHQERHYPGRVSGTDLVNPDFAALAQAFGAHGVAVERTEDFGDAFEEALARGRPAVIELRVDPEALTPRQSLSEIREQALAAGGGSRVRREYPRRRAGGADLALHRRGRGERAPLRLRHRPGRREPGARRRRRRRRAGALRVREHAGRARCGGCTFADVVKVTVFLTDVNDRPLINPVRQEVLRRRRVRPRRSSRSRRS